MSKTIVREKESIEDALRRFKRDVSRSGNLQEAKKRQTEQFKKSQIKKSQSRIEQNKAKKSTDSELVTMEDMKNSYKETSAVEKKGLFGRIRAERNRKNQMNKESEKTNEWCGFKNVYRY